MKKDYKKLYVDLEKQFNKFVKHRRHHPKICKYCKEWYQDVLKETKKIKDKKLRDNLTEVWKTLWLNNNSDWDIVAHVFEVK